MAYQKLQAGRAAVVTKSDTVNIPDPSGGVNNGCVLYVGTAILPTTTPFLGLMQAINFLFLVLSVG